MDVLIIDYFLRADVQVRLNLPSFIKRHLLLLTNLNAKPGEGEETSGKRGQIVRVGTLETSKEGGRVAHVRNLKLSEIRIDRIGY